MPSATMIMRSTSVYGSANEWSDDHTSDLPDGIDVNPHQCVRLSCHDLDVSTTRVAMCQTCAHAFTGWWWCRMRARAQARAPHRSPPLLSRLERDAEDLERSRQVLSDGTTLAPSV